MRLVTLFAVLTLSFPCYGTIALELTSSMEAPPAVGTPVTWTALATGSGTGEVEYQFTDRSHRRLLRAFHKSNRIVWTVSQAEGDYELEVTARNKTTHEKATAYARFHVISNIGGSMPTIRATANPLVALYSAPPCNPGSWMYVTFGVSGTSSSTNAAACTGNSSMNFYIGGMLPSTAYSMNYVIATPLGDGSYSEAFGPIQQFTTGPIDPSLAFPNINRIRTPDFRGSLTQGVLLLDYLSPPTGPHYFPTALDSSDRIIWYYPDLGVAAQVSTYFIRPIPNSQGHMLLIANDPASTPSNGQLLREIDLAGNTVSETYASQISEQLTAQGKVGITGFNHDAIRLPNGHTLVLCSQESIYPAGTQGSQNAVDILGDAIVDLDQNWNVTWSWSAYDHLDINTPAVLRETCYGQPGCPTLVLAPKANDWLHANSLNYLPDSGNLLLSIRHLDWVIKIDYSNGAGAGNVLWRLGLNGDFAIQSNDPYPWFSHQHDAQLNPSTGLFWAFDNGNTRVTQAGGVGNSRGYVLQLDEGNRTATPVLLADLGVYALAVGSAQQLDNGNFHFHAGMVAVPSPHAFTMEILPDGSQNSILEEFLQVYRSYRMASLYSLN